MQQSRYFIVFLILFSAGLPAGLQAELRPWSSKSGQSVEAEYLRMDDDLIVLRRRNDSIVKVSLDTLCEEGQKYAMLQSPPRIEIKVSDKVERRNIGYAGNSRNGSQLRNETVTTSVTLKKTSSDIYSLDLTVEVLLIGHIDALGRYIILERSSSTAAFTEENKGICTIECGSIDVRQITGSRENGTEYSGYLVVSLDQAGKIIGTKSSRMEFPRHVKELLKVKKGAVLDRDFNLIREGRPEREAGTPQ